MKTFLRNIQSAKYLDRSGNWTALRSEAQEFSDPGEAVDLCNKIQLKDVELIISFPVQRTECHVPLDRIIISSDSSGMYS